MKFFYKSMCCVFLMTLFFISQTSFAQSEDFETWKKQFKERALKEGISKKTLDKYVPQMTLLQRVVQQDMKKPEYLRNFWDYTSPRLTSEKIAKAKEIQKKYTTWLSRVEQQYQVPQEYLLALWSMETNFGSFMGKTPLLSSLASLSYHPRRREFFTKELLAYFKILESEPYPPFYGAWDGGIGHFQFMPTTYLAYAVDADNNGTRSLTGSIPDSLASAGNYLHRMGWKEKEPWGHQVSLPEKFDWEKIGQTKKVSEWKKMGVLTKENHLIPKEEEEIMAVLRAPMGSQGPTFLTYPNFKLINRWNKLELYALTTGMLADIISGKSDSPNRPNDFRPLKTETFCQLQKKLSEMGYYTSEIDGTLGPNMRQALRSFQTDNRIKVDGYPNEETLRILNIYKGELK